MSAFNRGLVVAMTTVGLVVAASPTYAAFRVTVTKADGFSLSQLKKVAVATTECDEVVDCSAIERKVLLEAQKLKLNVEFVPENVVRNLLFQKGHTAYSVELRELVASELGLDAIFELKIPFAAKGDGYGGRRGSEAKVEMTVVRPSGGILLYGVGTGRPLNVVTSPERVAGNIVERVFEEAVK